MTNIDMYIRRKFYFLLFVISFLLFSRLCFSEDVNIDDDLWSDSDATFGDFESFANDDFIDDEEFFDKEIEKAKKDNVIKAKDKVKDGGDIVALDKQEIGASPEEQDLQSLLNTENVDNTSADIIQKLPKLPEKKVSKNPSKKKEDAKKLKKSIKDASKVKSLPKNDDEIVKSLLEKGGALPKAQTIIKKKARAKKVKAKKNSGKKKNPIIKKSARIKGGINKKKDGEKEKELKSIGQSLKEKFVPEIKIDPNLRYNRGLYDYKKGRGIKSVQKKKFNKNNKHIPPVRYKYEYSEMLFSAILSNDVNAVKSLLAKGANINSMSKTGGYTPLMWAIKQGKDKVANYLMVKGADLNIQNDDGRAVIHVAAISDRIGMLRKLIDSDAKLSLIDKNGHIFLDYVSKDSIGEIATLMMKYDADLNRQFFRFVKYGSPKAVEYLMGLGVDINVTDPLGNNSLMIAVQNPDRDMVEFLLKQGVDVYHLNMKGLSAIDIAGIAGNRDFVALLESIMIKHELDSGVHRFYRFEHARNKNRQKQDHWYIENGKNWQFAPNANAPHRKNQKKGLLDNQVIMYNRPDGGGNRWMNGHRQY